MTIEKKEIINEPSKSPFLDSPKFIEWFGSYYNEVLEYNGGKYIINSKPHDLFYPGIFIVKVTKLISWLKYGDERREYSTMIFENGTIRPFVHWLSINNRKELNRKYPIIETEKNWYMRYDEKGNCFNLEGLPEGYKPSRWNTDNGTIQIYNNETSHSMIYSIDQDYKLEPIKWIPEWMYISDIKDKIATVQYYEKDKKHEFYLYDEKEKSVSPFEIENNEWKNYKIEAYSTDGNVINTVDENWNETYYYFDGTAKLNDKVTLEVNAKISELNKISQTARLYSIENSDAREWFYFYKDGIVKPFSWLQEHETIEYSDTYQFINPTSKVKALVIRNWDHHTEVRTFNQEWKIKSFKWLKTWWKAWNKIRESAHWEFFFLPIKIKGFGNETHGLLSKNSEKIIFYKDMLITWINPKIKSIILVTYEWPDCEIKLDDNERNILMKDWDSNYQQSNSTWSIIELSSQDLTENLQ